ncbi:non-ribosomal peptide synthetase [Streptomyces sp. RK62]|uniref:non-ribosomal peptide synthetase n=1 Tax=Streptomyces sp. RK62 TaxID=2824893 RepID=UPI001B388B7B|nr:non-ribosomal peptide synthetase [Streptomyces sp. RK62]MBQ0997435.1 amino acid adenylation domain-containing protein [Streptomyces sp. RK62]
MTLVELLAALTRASVRLSSRDGRLVVSGPPGALDAPLRAALAQHRTELLTRLAGQPPAPARSPATAPPRRYAPSFGQERLLFFDALRPGSAAYNVSSALHLTGPVDVSALQRSAATVVKRNAALRTCFAREDGRPVAVVADRLRAPMPIVDLSCLTPDERSARYEARCAAIGGRGFDLAHAPLWRWELLRLGPHHIALVAAFHHSICDGWSLAEATRQLAADYAARLAGVPTGSSSQPADEVADYAAYGQWQRAYAASAAHAADERHWRDRVGSFPRQLDLPGTRLRPRQLTDRGGRHAVRLSPGLDAAVRRTARAHGVSLAVLFTAAYGLLLHRWSGRDRLLFGTAVANRPSSQFQRTFGFFVNWLPIRSELHGEPTFHELVQAMRTVCLDAHEHQNLPFDHLVRVLGGAPDLSRHALFQHMLVFHVPARRVHLADVACSLAPYPTGTAKVDLTLFVTDCRDAVPLAGAGGDLLLEFEYSSDLYDAAMVRRLADAFVRLLELVTDAPHAAVRTLDIDPGPRTVSAATAQNAAAPPDADVGPRRPRPDTLPALFDAQVRRTPAAPALEHDGRTVSYAELAQDSVRIAEALRVRGIGRGDRVGVCLDRSVAAVAAILGVLRAGAAYVPLDPNLPARRLRGLAHDAACALLLVDRAGCADPLQPHTATVEELLRAPVDDRAAPAETNGDDPIYLIYTSGSSGAPKGVVCRHSSVVNFVAWLNQHLSTTPADRVLLKTPLSFDASVRELFAPLTAGACVVLAPPGPRVDPDELNRVVHRAGVTIFHAVPSLYDELLRRPTFQPSALRHVVCGGETLSPAVLARHRERCPATLHNVYGPTEATVDVTVWTDDARPHPPFVPIGRPIAGHRITIIDPELTTPVPAGAAGELVISGPGVALGYWNRPELTARSFVPDPQGEPGARQYRTGDRGRLLPDGSVELLGRVDRQVKIRGHRIEPEEVERVLLGHSSVAAAAVVPATVAGDPALLAYVVSEAGHGDDLTHLPRFLSDRLPAEMVPRLWVPLAELPRQANGKVNLAALPAPPEEQPAPPPTHDPARTHHAGGRSHERIAALFAALLGTGPVPDDGDFFRLGGHSLLAVQLVARLQEMFGVPLTVSDVFEQPTVQGLAQAVTRARQASGTARPPLQPAQRPTDHGTTP